MPEVLEYGRPQERQRPATLAFFANATVVYPLMIVAALYLTWLDARMALGRSPRPMIESYNPSILGMFIVYFGILGSPLVALASLILNIVYVWADRISLQRGTVRLLVMLAVWIGMWRY